MALEQDPKNPVVWTNSDWNGREPATFAFVIGVSAYDHLDGSASSFGLGQLAVSALTAHRFFRWLDADYYCEGKPLAKCWLMLSPTAAERQAEASMPDTPIPRFNDCRLALEHWRETMGNVDSFAIQESRALFFFSGHGLEMEFNRQILLTADYRPARNAHWALSSDNIVEGLSALPLAEQVFLIDACRDDAEDLRTQNPQGTQVFNRVPPSQRRGDAEWVVIHAAGPGTKAWQPTDPCDGVSVFGDALDQALRAQSGMRRECDDRRCWVTFRDVVDFLRPRVQELLLGAGITVPKPVYVWPDPSTAEVCEVPIPTPRPPGAPPVPGGDREPRLPQPISPTELSLAYKIAAVDVPRDWERPADSGTRVALHGLLRSEFMTNLLWDARVYNFRDRTWADVSHTERPAPIAVRQIARTANRALYHLDVQMERRGTFWFELNDEQAERRAACMLPGDDRSVPRYTIELTFGSGGGTIIAFDIVLAEENEGVLGELAAAAQADASASVEISTLSGWLSEAMRQRSPSPLAATVAALMLLRRRGGDEVLNEWSGQLIETFPGCPDAYVIHAEHMLRTGVLPAREVVPVLLQLERAGLPWTGEAIGLAARQIEGLLNYGFDPEPQRSPEQLDEYGRLQSLRERFGRVAAVFRPHGLCVTLLGPAELVTPALLEADEGGDVRRDPSGGREAAGPRKRTGGSAEKVEEVEVEVEEVQRMNAMA
jgi:hypothetical protein